MDFVRRFETHQIERIRRAIIAYRGKHNVGDTGIADEVLAYLPASVTHDSTVKNVQRLRNGDHIRGAAFLNACVKFLEVEMVTPPDEALGLAMKQFIGDVSVSGYVHLWQELEGTYVMRVLGERQLDLSAAFAQTQKPVTGIAVTPQPKQPEAQDSFTVLSISPGEGNDYGIVQERYFMREDDVSTNEESQFSEVNTLNRKGVCLPVGGQDMLILIRDFLFSHMYVLHRESFGFAGTMIMPTSFGPIVSAISPGTQQSQCDVALHRIPQE
ncbi:MAG: hypothetical protein NXI27_07045 [Alphaproteobacteria bacterium]|nr:hypothetical protein [Alphaproteobacteria bacterium]